jgi:streptomycin 6-kinase
MAATTFPAVPPGCRRRLTVHYGPSVNSWVDTAPELLTTVAARWSVTLDGYHDAGHASVIATVTDRSGQSLLLKVWPDRDRYTREIYALQLWHRGAEAVVHASDDGLAAAALVTVGGIPGGADRPPHEAGLVATALQRAHETGRRSAGMPGLPSLHDFVTDEVLPRVRHRYAVTGMRRLAEHALPYISGLREDPRRQTVLHADLYRENVPFTRGGRPILLDPLPMTGDTAYDWAFWCVYYQLGHGTGRRLYQASRASGIPAEEILPWCLFLSLDGLLYYEETGDSRTSEMTALLNALIERASRCPP